VTSPHIPGRAQLARCQKEAAFWRNYAALARFARPDHLPPLRNQNRRRLWPRPPWHRARTVTEIPQQRAVPQGLPPRSRIGLPRR
jgi:hypothetical protein